MPSPNDTYRITPLNTTDRRSDTHADHYVAPETLLSAAEQLRAFCRNTPQRYTYSLDIDSFQPRTTLDPTRTNKMPVQEIVFDLNPYVTKYGPEAFPKALMAAKEVTRTVLDNLLGKYVSFDLTRNNILKIAVVVSEKDSDKATMLINNVCYFVFDQYKNGMKGITVSSGEIDIPFARFNSLFFKEFGTCYKGIDVFTGKVIYWGGEGRGIKAYGKLIDGLIFEKIPKGWVYASNFISNEIDLIKQEDIASYGLFRFHDGNFYKESDIKDRHPDAVYSEFDDAYCLPNRIIRFRGQERFADGACEFVKSKGTNTYPRHSPNYSLGNSGYSFSELYEKGQISSGYQFSHSSALYSYGAKAEWIFGFIDDRRIAKCRPDKKNRYFGFEIEVERGTSTDSWSTQMTKELLSEPSYLEMGFLPSADGSLSNGVEFKSAPMTKNIAKKSLKHFYKYIEDNHNFVAKPTAGFHIHVSRESLSEMQIARILTFVHAYGNRSDIERIAGRNGNRYAKLDMSRGMTVQTTKRRLKEGTTVYDNKISVNDDRYVAVNIGPNTIEFRLFACAAKYSDAMRCFDFVKALLEYTTPGSVPYVYRDHVKFTSFERWLSKPENLKEYPFLAKFLGLSKTKVNKHNNNKGEQACA